MGKKGEEDQIKSRLT